MSILQRAVKSRVAPVRVRAGYSIKEAVVLLLRFLSESCSLAIGTDDAASILCGRPSFSTVGYGMSLLIVIGSYPRFLDS